MLLARRALAWVPAPAPPPGRLGPPAAPTAAAQSRGHARSTRVLRACVANAPSAAAPPTPASGGGPTNCLPGSSVDHATPSAGRGLAPTPRVAAPARTPPAPAR